MQIDASGHIHTGYTSNFGGDHVNVLASDGGGISIAQNNAGTATSGTILGSLSFQSYLNGQTLAEAEARISAIAAENQSGSAAGTDLAFYTKPNGTGPGSAPSERMRIDSLGGITSASQAGGHVVFNSNTTDSDFRVAWNNGTHALYVDGATGNLGIGTSLPTAPLTLFSTGWKHLELTSSESNSDNKTGYVTVRHYTNAEESFGVISGQSTASTNVLNIGGGGAGLNAATSINLYTAANNTTVTGTPRVTIDASGNLLVGTTDTTPYNNTSGGGFVVASNGLTSIARETTASNQAVLHLNNTGVDGIIAEFAKAGTTVGSIGVAAGPVAYIVLNDAASDNVAALKGASGAILPSTNAGADKDGTMNLGSSDARFESLYLSDGVVFGDAGGSGTSSSNTLDSYEEGTWTPTLVGSTSGSATITVSGSANYTKVGNKVFAACYIGTIDLSTDTIVGSMRIGGLPFSGASRYTQSVSIMYQNISTTYPNLSGYVQTNHVEINQNATTTTLARSDCVSTASRTIMIGVTYITA
jgi:hypothetical protein